MDKARLVLGVMFAAARMRNETVSLIRFAGDAAATHAGVEVVRATTPSKELAVAWFERARLGTTEDVRYAVRFFKDGKSAGTYALPAVTRMPPATADEVAFEAAEREAMEVRNRHRMAASLGHRLGQALARGKA